MKKLFVLRVLKFTFIFSLLFPLLFAQEDLDNVWAVKDCKIITQAGQLIEKKVILIKDGLIENVGVNIIIPPEVEIIDGSKLTVYPGFIDILWKSLLKLPQEKTEDGTQAVGEPTEKERGITPKINAYEYADLSKSSI